MKETRQRGHSIIRSQRDDGIVLNALCSFFYWKNCPVTYFADFFYYFFFYYSATISHLAQRSKVSVSLLCDKKKKKRMFKCNNG